MRTSGSVATVYVSFGWSSTTNTLMRHATVSPAEPGPDSSIPRDRLQKSNCVAAAQPPLPYKHSNSSSYKRRCMVNVRGKRLNRRGLLAASAVGLGAATLAASGITPASAGSDDDPGNTARHGLTEAVLAALRTHRLVGLGEEHALQEHHDVLQTMLADPRLPGLVNDIVVENGNALYQDIVDAFVVDGKPVADADLRPAWRNTTQSPNEALDAPVYEQLLRRVRAVNWTLPPSRRIRVLLGEQPLDWSTITTSEQLRPFIVHRDEHAASVIEQQVLDKGRRALLCYGSGHLLHYRSGQYLVDIIEQNTGVRTYTIVDLVPLQPDPSGLATKLANYPRGTVIPTAGTWLGQLDAASALPISTVTWCGVPLGELLDAAMYLGQPADLTVSWANPAVYLDPTYWAELQRRDLIAGKGGPPVDLTPFRQEKPPTYPTLPASAC